MYTPETAAVFDEESEIVEQPSPAFEAPVKAEVYEAPQESIEENVDPGLQLAAQEFGVKPQELRQVDLSQTTKKEATATVLGEQRFFNGKILDADGNSVLDKMLLARNVSITAIRNQRKMETDLLLTGQHVSDRFLWEGKVVITVTRLVDRKKGTLTYTNYEVDPERQSSAELQATYPFIEQTALAEKETRDFARAVETEPTQAARTVESGSDAGSAIAVGLQKEVNPEREVRRYEDRFEINAALDRELPERLPRSPGPEKATASERIGSLQHNSANAAQSHREIIHRIQDSTGVITMTRYRNRAAA